MCHYAGYDEQQGKHIPPVAVHQITFLEIADQQHYRAQYYKDDARILFHVSASVLYCLFIILGTKKHIFREIRKSFGQKMIRILICGPIFSLVKFGVLAKKI